jgi:nucleotide-binding universal stress UspA family protein
VAVNQNFAEPQFGTKRVMMNNILVPCDFSPVATEAFKFALDVARQREGKITVLFAADLPVFVGGLDVQPYVYDPTLVHNLQVWAEARFDELAKLNVHNIPLKLETRKSTVRQAVCKSIGDNNIDLVVMGTHGAQGVNEMLFGSNTEKIVRSSPVPVFSIRTAVPFHTITRILFPTDLATIDSAMMDSLRELQKLFDASLDILWVNTPLNFRTDEAIEEKVARLAADHSLTNYSLRITNALDTEGGIIGYAHKSNADIIAMSTHGKRGLSHLVDGSLAENVVNHMKLPVWTYCVADRFSNS